MAGHFHTWNSFHSPEHLSRISPHYQRSTGFVPWCSFPWTWHLVSRHLLAPLSRFNRWRRREHVNQKWSLRLLLLFWNEAECWRFWRSPASRRLGNKIPTKSCCNIDLVMESERETDMEESINRLGLLCNCAFPQWSTSKQTHNSKREEKKKSSHPKTHMYKQRTETALTRQHLMPTSQYWASWQWKAEGQGRGRKQLNHQGSFFKEVHLRVCKSSHHIDRAGACCGLAVLLWVTDRLVVVGLVEGVQRGVDQVDHQHRVHLAKELTDLGEQANTEQMER